METGSAKFSGAVIYHADTPSIHVAHCRLPAWEPGEVESHSAPFSIGISYTTQRCALAHHGSVVDREVQAHSTMILGQAPPSWLRVDAPSELVEVSAASAWRNALAEELRCGEPDLADVDLAHDPVSWALTSRLGQLAMLSDFDPLEVEELAQRLYAHIFVSAFGGRYLSRGHGALDAARLRRVADFVVAHLGEPLDLARLAGVAALSPYHFHRAFRTATGTTPHAYVALWRQRTALDLFAAGRPTEEIVPAVGMADRRALWRLLGSRGCTLDRA